MRRGQLYRGGLKPAATPNSDEVRRLPREVWLATEDEIREVKRRHSAELMRQKGVCGVGVEKDETGEFVIALHLDTDDPAVQARLPKVLEGCRVKLIKSGPFRKFSTG